MQLERTLWNPGLVVLSVCFVASSNFNIGIISADFRKERLLMKNDFELLCNLHHGDSASTRFRIIGLSHVATFL
jgi:hypothetical protein